ncbi:hypothetical protein T439DRAFT_346675 [Meredithblackwellia eburnea MCA 4105]
MESAGWIKHGESGIKRRILGSELYWSAQAGFDQLAGVCAIHLRCTISSTTAVSPSTFEAALKNAWIQVRFHDCPGIGLETQIQDLVKIDTFWFHYSLVNGESVKDWAESTVVPCPPTSSGIAFADSREANYVRPQSGPAAFLDWAPDSQSPAGSKYHILLRCGHWLCDARGAYTVLDRLLHHLASPSLSQTEALAWGEETSRLGVALSVRAGLRTFSEKGDGSLAPTPIDERNEFAGKFRAKVAAEKPTVVFPPPSKLDIPAPSPSTTSLASRVTFSPETTLKLVHETRARKSTVTTLFIAAYLLASISWHGPSGMDLLDTAPVLRINHVPFDLRPLFIEKFEGREKIGLYISGCHLEIDSQELKSLLQSAAKENKSEAVDGIWKVAASMRDQFAKGMADPLMRLGVKFSQDNFATRLPAMVEAGVPARPALSLTSLGRLSSFLHAPPPTSNWSIFEPVLECRMPFMTLWTCVWEWDGQFAFVVKSSKDAWAQGQLDKFTGEVKRWLEFTINAAEVAN